jgi:8-oxo-dGTP diphosphatase
MKDATLCYIFDNDKVLLQKKAKGRFGEGKWNAPGGKIRFSESASRAVKREVREETGLTVNALEKKGILNFMEEGGKWFTVHVYRTDAYSGEPADGPEGTLAWFKTSDIPYNEMWEDDKLWMPRLLKGKAFQGSFLFSKGFKNLIKHTIEDV